MVPQQNTHIHNTNNHMHILSPCIWPLMQDPSRLSRTPFCSGFRPLDFLTLALFELSLLQSLSAGCVSHLKYILQLSSVARRTPSFHLLWCGLLVTLLNPLVESASSFLDGSPDPGLHARVYKSSHQHHPVDLRACTVHQEPQTTHQNFLAISHSLMFSSSTLNEFLGPFLLTLSIIGHSHLQVWISVHLIFPLPSLCNNLFKAIWCSSFLHLEKPRLRC